MRNFIHAGLALACLAGAGSALACDTVLDPDRRFIDQPGKYCLAADRTAPVAILADNVELDCAGHRLTWTPGDGNDGIGVHLRRGDKATVRNCRLYGWSYGILVSERGNAQVINNTVDAGGIGIAVQGSDRPQDENARLIGNRIFYYGPGNGANAAIEIQHAAKPVLINNVVAGFRGWSAIWLDRAPDARLTGNQLLDLNEGGSAAVRMEYSPRAHLVHNTAMLRRGLSGRGLVGALDATCVENVFINTSPSGFDECSVKRDNVEQIVND
ncbi:right-handed parallel beta-helix repeat-containing protein [Lysobacter enzymogenes]|uniref:right-handed parallel beta-helix repeat-containing protein n=1 Tax=Lysobacter enzymogenes TaxID=69 RepID=UPI001A97AC3F|nr:right-handed parallel beta-helix repeat-containing protein [Lysobacter enzymogenes]QQP97315.1 right-handed parallel beta-helix repeat-containing protein [Lysobacter enzymogenes]